MITAILVSSNLKRINTYSTYILQKNKFNILNYNGLKKRVKYIRLQF